MRTYLVGGAVRDHVMQYAANDLDYVVVGSSVEEMLSEGFTQVGKDFPVFLHPETQAEYALARTERKTGHGYGGFVCDSSSKITLEDDLLRRDLTINSMAMDEDGNIIDPFGGQQDIKDKILRHTSEAFVEDPVRVLRLFRFQAKLGPEWTIASATLELIDQMYEMRELEYLVPERISLELLKALDTKNFNLFIRGLLPYGIFSELHDEEGLANILDTMSRIGRCGYTKLSHLLSHLTQSDILEFCDTYCIPSKHRDTAIDYHNYLHDGLCAGFESAKAEHTGNSRSLRLLATIVVNTRGGVSGDNIITAREAYRSVTIDDVPKSVTGKDIGETLRRLRRVAVEECLYLLDGERNA